MEAPKGSEQPSPRRARVLVVDADEDALAALERLLQADGFSTVMARNGDEALAEAGRALPDVVLADLQMQPMNGLELCRRFRAIDSDLPVIVMTARSDMNSAIESLRAGAEDYLIKPLDYDAARVCLDLAVTRHTAKVAQQEIRRALNERLVLSSIREQEHAEAEAYHHAQLNALLGHVQEGVVIVGPSGRLLMLNDAARAILGTGEAEVRTLDELQSAEVHDLEGRPVRSEQRPLERALRGEQFSDYETLRAGPNGNWRRLVSTGTSVRDEDGNVALAIVVFRDVTELRRLEQQRDEYLALVSHDLRNPLNSILMCVSMLKASMRDKGLTEDETRAERAMRNVDQISAMLDELTEATSLEARGVELQRRACDLREIVARVVDGLDEVRARRITIETDDGASHVVFGDASRLERAVANIVTNALKYSADAPVKVQLARKGNIVELDVIDCGIGIAPESVTMLFERYYRTTAGKARSGGLGLGLYIARQIVELHGGRIDVSSEVGKGSTFRVILPLHAVSA